MTRLLDVAPQVRAVLCIGWLEEITQAAPSTRLIQAPAALPVGMMNRIIRGPPAEISNAHRRRMDDD
jgi:hypothetical protein